MVTHSSILPWRIPWTEEPGRLQSMQSPQVRHDGGTKHSTWVLCIIIQSEEIWYHCISSLSYFILIFFMYLYICIKGSESVSCQQCLTLCNPMDCSPPGSSIHGILQARIQESVDIPFFWESSRPRDRTGDFCITGRFFTVWATKEVYLYT